MPLFLAKSAVYRYIGLCLGLYLFLAGTIMHTQLLKWRKYVAIKDPDLLNDNTDRDHILNDEEASKRITEFLNFMGWNTEEDSI